MKAHTHTPMHAHMIDLFYCRYSLVGTLGGPCDCTYMNIGIYWLCKHW